MSGSISDALAAIDWQAAATFFTGVMAVGAAIWVGKKQTAILHRQTVLAENSIKVELLDRRIACIEKIREVRVGLSPGGTENFSEQLKLYEALKTAEFLFPEKSVGLFSEISDAIHLAVSADRLADAMARRGDEPARQKALDRFFQLNEKIWDALPVLEADLVANARIVLGDDAFSAS